MALTLIEAAKLHSGDSLRAGVIQIYASASPVLGILPFDNISGNALRYNLEDTLPGIGFRGVNEGYPESVGVINPQVEMLTIAGGDLDVDTFIIKTMGADQRSVQEAAKVKALSHKWGQTFIKGDSSVNPKEFDGLQARLTGSQVVSNNTAADGGALSLGKLDEAIDATDSPTHLIMRKSLIRRLTVAARTTTVGGDIQYTVDQFGRRITQYSGLPIIPADPTDVPLPMITEDEAYSGGGTADGTSIYVVSIGEGKISGIQNGDIDVRDLGELEEKPAFRTRVEWFSAFGVWHPRAATRLRDIDASLAAVV